MLRSKLFARAAVLAAVVVSPAIAQQAPGQQAMDPVFADHQKAWTTKPEFSSPLVDHLPASTGVPSPRDVLGHDIGAPRVLDHYADILKYYRALATKTNRVKIVETGATEEGRATVVGLISAEGNIASLEHTPQT